MKEVENLLITVSEECSEIQQACSKIQQAVSKSLWFGLDNHHPARQSSNKEEILTEYYQLAAMIELLQEKDVLPKFGEKDIEATKRNKVSQVKEYLELSRDLGIVNI